jgi:hypothetical protein
MTTHPTYIFTSPPRGYVALVSALIISAILTALIFTESTSTFWARFDQLNRENRHQAYLLAESCLYEGLLLYAEDPSTSRSSAQVAVDAHTSCILDSTKVQNGVVTIVAHAKVKNVYSIMSVTATKNSSGVLSITSWRELTSIPP